MRKQRFNISKYFYRVLIIFFVIIGFCVWHMNYNRIFVRNNGYLNLKNDLSHLSDTPEVNKVHAADVLFLNRIFQNCSSEHLSQPWIVPQVQETNCSLLFSGSRKEIQNVKSILSTHKNTIVSDKHLYQRIKRNCTRFVNERMYIKKPLHRKEADFPLAFSIMVYKDMIQVERMFRLIYRPQNLYCFHVDSKSSKDFYNAVRAYTRCFNNVHLLSNRVDVQWGKFTVLEPVLLCIRYLSSIRGWKYFINLTGQELPLKTNWELVQILNEYNGSNDIQGSTGSAIERRVKHRINSTEAKPPPPYHIQPYKGSFYITASREFIRFIMEDKRPQKFLQWLKDTMHPDESFFSSINYNSHLKAPGSFIGSKDAGERQYLTKFVTWRTGSRKCHGQFVRDVCILGVGDLQLLSSAKQLFANKFYHDYEYLAMNCMEQLYMKKVSLEYRGCEKHLDLKYYRNLPFVKYHI